MAKDIKKIIRAQIALTKKETEKFSGKLEKFLDRWLDDILSELDDNDTLNAQRLGALMTNLKARGLDDVIADVQGLYANELRRIDETYKLLGLDIPATALDENVATALVTFQAEKIETTVRSYVDTLRPILMENVLLDTRPDISALKDLAASRVYSNVKTEIRTGLVSFNRTVNQLRASEAGLTLFFYVGPIIENTRDFCRALIEDRDPPIYERSEIEGMDNGQGLPVLTFGGGYNCIHHWQALTEQKAKELGYGD